MQGDRDSFVGKVGLVFQRVLWMFLTCIELGTEYVPWIEKAVIVEYCKHCIACHHEYM